MSTFSII